MAAVKTSRQGRINRSSFKNVSKVVNLTHDHWGAVRPAWHDICRQSSGRGHSKWVCHPSLDLFITPLHIPHHEPGSGERVDREGRDDEKN